MTESPHPTGHSDTATKSPASRVPGRWAAAAQLLAAATAWALCAVVALFAHGLTNWNVAYLAILAALAVTSEFTATLLPSGSLTIS
ncbi:MAG: hypothetical protein M0T77_02385, partial [Actinomycetota bacterium]|nr:hypothetical protein [Actinomycetota bacterium]